jgi:hypothetical protein
MKQKVHKHIKKHPYLPIDKIWERAKRAYLVYAKTNLKNSAPGNYMPMWEDITQTQRNAWRAVVLAIHQSN